jgi:RHS repeat-associated protein
VTAYYRANGMIVASQRYVTNGASQHFYIHRPNSLSTFYAYDGLGSVAALSNFRGWSGTGSRYGYDVFGSLREGSLNKNPYGFTGKRFDAESGLYHFHFRKYDPSTGVWTTPDPIDIVGGLNLYGYVSSNPVNFVDPWGLEDSPVSHSDWFSRSLSPSGGPPRGVDPPPLTSEQKQQLQKAFENLFNNISNFFPGPNTTTLPKEILENILDEIGPLNPMRPKEAEACPN